MVKIIDNYTLYEVLGEGSYGKVYRAVNRIDKKQYAVKVVQTKKFMQDKKLEEYTVNEINILTNMEKTPHIIGYYDMFKSQTNFYFIYQFCNGGTLQTILSKQHKLPEKQALKILKQLLQAFRLLYKFNVVHRDLKPDNIFFSDGIVKLGDFGFCKSLEKTKMTKTMLGSPIYMAPQILKEQVYSSKADIWSIGVVLFQMLYGYCPFQSSSIPKLIKVLDSCDVCFPDNVRVSKETKELIRKILTKNPKKRIEWKDLFDIKISQEGQYVNNEAKINSQISNSRKGSWDSPTHKKSEMAKTVSNRSLSKGHVGVVTKIKRQQTLRQIEPTHSETNIHKNVSVQKKLHPIQEDTDDQSRKNVLIRRQKAFSKVKPALEERSQTNLKTQDDFNTYLKKVTSGIANQHVFRNRQKVVTRHNQILKGITIAKNLQYAKQNSTTLFSVFLYRAVLQKLQQFRKQLEGESEYSDVIELVDNEIIQYSELLKNLERQCTEYEDLLSSEKFVLPMRRILRQKLPQCKNLRLGYQMAMYLVNENICGGLTNDQMTRIISLKLI